MSAPSGPEVHPDERPGGLLRGLGWFALPWMALPLVLAIGHLLGTWLSVARTVGQPEHDVRHYRLESLIEPAWTPDEQFRVTGDRALLAPSGDRAAVWIGDEADRELRARFPETGYYTRQGDTWTRRFELPDAPPRQWHALWRHDTVVMVYAANLLNGETTPALYYYGPDGMMNYHVVDAFWQPIHRFSLGVTPADELELRRPDGAVIRLDHKLQVLASTERQLWSARGVLAGWLWLVLWVACYRTWRRQRLLTPIGASVALGVLVSSLGLALL